MFFNTFLNLDFVNTLQFSAKKNELYSVISPMAIYALDTLRSALQNITIKENGETSRKTPNYKSLNRKIQMQLKANRF